MNKNVLILMGSDSDFPVMEESIRALDRMKISYEVHVASAHRSPQKVIELSAEAKKRGFAVIVCGAGMAAHLAGVVAAHTTLPVLGVPMAAGTLGGLDSLLSTVQMPPGIPVATLGLAKAGAFNAGLLAAQILAVYDDEIANQLQEYRDELAQKVEQKDAELQKKK